MRRAGRVDANQGLITEALRAAGCSVLSLAGLGNGAPDLLVARRGTFCLEVKDSDQPPSKRRLRPLQEKFRKEWKGDLFTVETVQEALDVLRWVESHPRVASQR